MSPLFFEVSRGSTKGNNHVGVYGVQAAQLHDDEEQATASGPRGVQEVLPFLQEAHAA